MTERGDRSDAARLLRRRAEERLAAAARARPGSRDPADLVRLVHELEVHEIELEMQNEDLRAARAEVEAGLHRYTELFECAPMGYAALDTHGVICDVNLEGARLLQSPRAALTGRRFAWFVRSEDRKAFADLLDAVLAGQGQAGEICELVLSAEGKAALEVALFFSTLRGPAGQVLVAIKDISARKRAEEALREESRRKDDFLAVLSHELRNPLAAIRSGLGVLERVEPGRAQARKATEAIERQVTHLVRIVNDLLDVSRIARGKIRLERKRLELGALVRRAMDDHLAEFHAAGVDLEGRSASQEFWVEADGTRLVQVLDNLLTNALKFTLPGGRVTVELRLDGAQVRLSMHDTGVGIAPEMRESLFEPFMQAPQTIDRTTGGLGLGLAMVKGLVDVHGGTVDVASAGIGQGATFTVRLPLVAAPANVAATAAPLSPVIPGRRVLVIEDNRDAGDTLCDLLEMDGYSVQAAYDGPSGMALAGKSHPEIVLCDLGLPGMDGYQVARAMRSDDALRGAYLIALSGYARPADVQRCLEAGFDRHFAKPVTMAELERAMVEGPARAHARSPAASPGNP